MLNRVNQPTKLCIIAGGSFSEFNVSLAIAKRAIDSLLHLSEFKISLFILEQNFEVIECDPIQFLNETSPEDIFFQLKNRPLLYRKSEIKKGSVAKLLAIAIENSDLIFPLMQGPLGECGAIQGFLKIFNKPFASVDVLGSAVCKDKEIQKRILKSNNIPILPFKAFKSFEKNSIDYRNIVFDFGNNLVLKPGNLGSSIGVELVQNEPEFYQAIDRIFELSNKLIIEPFIKSHEYEFYVTGDDFVSVQAPFLKIMPGKVIQYEDKYLSKERLNTPVAAFFQDEKLAEMKKLVEKSYRVCECDFFARVDIFIDHENRVFVNEINSIPALDTHTNTELFKYLFDFAFTNHSKKQKYLKRSLF